MKSNLENIEPVFIDLGKFGIYYLYCQSLQNFSSSNMEKGPKSSSEDSGCVENDAKRAATLEARMEGIEASIKCVVSGL